MVSVLFFEFKALKDWILNGENKKVTENFFVNCEKLRKISLRTWEDSTIMEVLTGTREGEWLWEKNAAEGNRKREKLRRRSAKESAEAC